MGSALLDKMNSQVSTDLNNIGFLDCTLVNLQRSMLLNRHNGGLKKASFFNVLEYERIRNLVLGNERICWLMFGTCPTLHQLPLLMYQQKSKPFLSLMTPK